MRKILFAALAMLAAPALAAPNTRMAGVQLVPQITAPFLTGQAGVWAKSTGNSTSASPAPPATSAPSSE